MPDSGGSATQGASWTESLGCREGEQEKECRHVSSSSYDMNVSSSSYDMEVLQAQACNQTRKRWRWTRRKSI